MTNPYNQAPGTPYGQPDPHANPYQVTYQAAPMAPYQPYGMVPAYGRIGQVRGTGMCILLMIVTFGIYGLVWFYQVHQEMKDHTGDGLGGGLALLIDFFFGVVMWFITPGEVGTMYRRQGWNPPVSAATGCWVLLPLVGGIIWFVKTNGALNDYWRAFGAAG